MHGSIQITDTTYGDLPEENIQKVLNTFQNTRQNPPAALAQSENLPPELIQLARLLLDQYNQNAKKT